MAKKKEELAPPALTEGELYKLKYHEAADKQAQTELTLLALRREIYLRQIDPSGKLAEFDKNMREAADRASAHKREHNDVLTKAAERLKLDLADYSYDDETGQLMYCKP